MSTAAGLVAPCSTDSVSQSATSLKPRVSNHPYAAAHLHVCVCACGITKTNRFSAAAVLLLWWCGIIVIGTRKRLLLITKNETTHFSFLFGKPDSVLAIGDTLIVHEQFVVCRNIFYGAVSEFGSFSRSPSFANQQHNDDSSLILVTTSAFVHQLFS